MDWGYQMHEGSRVPIEALVKYVKLSQKGDETVPIILKTINSFPPILAIGSFISRPKFI